jgi:hypothetical protein
MNSSVLECLIHELNTPSGGAPSDSTPTRLCHRMATKRQRKSPLAIAFVAITIAITGALSRPRVATAAIETTSIVPIVPTRLLDTRNGIGAPAAKVAPNGTIELTVTGATSGVPNDATAVAMNITAVNPDDNGYVTVWPCGTPKPNASNLNVTAGQTIPNLVITKLGNNGKVCIYTQPGAHLLADLTAFWGEVTSGVPDSTTLDTLTPSGASAPAGDGSVADLPTGGSDFEPGPPVAANPVSSAKPPTAAQMASAPWAPSYESSLRALSDTQVRPGAQALLKNEPTYPIGSAGYLSSLNPAVGRVVMWTYDAANGWRRASSCSGTVTGPNMVLTAAHCLTHGDNPRTTEREDSTPWDGYSFIPGLVGESMPAGEWWAAGNRAWAHQLWFDSRATTNWSLLFDYGFIKFDPQHNGNRNLSDATGSFQIRMQDNLVGRTLVNVGYPAEGYYSNRNGGYCDPLGIWCYPYKCESTGAANAPYGNGWNMIGFGCNANGGISGSGVFSQIDGTWYVVSVMDMLWKYVASA